MGNGQRLQGDVSMSSSSTAKGFVQNVILGVCYRNPFDSSISPVGENRELAFQAIKFDFGHSASYVLHGDDGLAIETTFDELAASPRSYWVARERNANWKSMQGVRIVSAGVVVDAAGVSQHLVLDFSNGSTVRIEPDVHGDEVSEFWPARSRLLRISFSHTD